jgi:hypothetical protein
VEAFALAVRTEVAHHGVDVGVAYLSFTDTDMTRGAGLQSGPDVVRERLPGPLGRLYKLGPAVDRLVAGIERRAPFVYGQSFIRWLRPLRWLLPSAAYVAGKRGAAQAEQAMTGREIEVSQPVGAGGQADVEARGRRGIRPSAT